MSQPGPADIRNAAVLVLLLVLLITVGAQSQAAGADEQSAGRSSRDNRELDTPFAAHREISELQWRLGVIARDEQHDPIKAAHYFYRAARSAGLAEQEKRAEDFLLAAQNAAGSVDHTFLHDGVISGVAFSPNGQSVLTWSGTGRKQDHMARLWDTEDGRLIRSFDHGASVRGAVFSPDGRQLLTWADSPTPGGDGSHSWLWDVTRDEPVRAFGDRFGQIEDAAFTADSSRFFVWSDERRTWAADRKGTLWLWEIKKDEAVLSLRDYVDTPNRHGPAKPTIIHAPRPPLEDKQDFDAWREDLKRKEQLVRGLPHPGPVVGATFSPDGTRLATWCDWADSVRLWDLKQKKLLDTLSHPHKRIAGAAFDADAAQLLIWNDTTGQGGYRGWFSSFRVWDLSGYRPRPLPAVQYREEINGAAFAPDGERVLAWSDDRTARLWNVRQRELLRTIPLKGPVGGAVLNAEGTRAFAWRSPDSRVWDAGSGELLQTFTHEAFRGTLGGGASNAAGTRFLTWSANDTIGDEVELTHERGFVWLWDVGRQKPLHTLRHDGWVTAARFDADGSRVLSASEDNTARLWDAEGGKALQTFRHEGDVWGAVFGPDESRVVTWGGRSVSSGDQDSTVRLWEAETGELLATFLHTGVVGAKLNADGSRLLSWDYYEAKLWDVGSDRLLKTFPTQADGILGISFRIDMPWIVIRDGADSDIAGRVRRLWKSVKDMPAASYRAPGSRRIVISRDLTRACALFDYPGSGELLSPRLDGPICVLRPAEHEGATFSPDATRLLTWGRALQLWDITLRDRRPVEVQLREHELRTATRLDDFGRVQVLPFQDWQELIHQQQVEAPQ